jgi:opacity protein-like surface antigen
LNHTLETPIGKQNVSLFIYQNIIHGKFKMKNTIIAVSLLCTAFATFGMSAPARADVGQNTIGPSWAIGAGQTNFGIDSKFGVSDNLSLRPFVYFPRGGTDFGTALTYDFKLPSTPGNLQLTPFLGGAVDFNSSTGASTITTASVVGGADFNVTDNIQLKAALVVPLSTTSGQTTTVTLGGGLRF